MTRTLAHKHTHTQTHTHDSQAVALDAERQHHRAAVDARISQQAAREACARAVSQSAQLEHRTAESQAAVVAKQRLQRLAGRRAQQVCVLECLQTCVLFECICACVCVLARVLVFADVFADVCMCV